MSNREEFINKLKELPKEEILKRYITLLDIGTLTDYVSDLEAKLAESESESNARYSAWQEEIGECDRLRVALAEKDAEVQSWKDGTMVVKLGKLEEQLAEKDEQIEYLKGTTISIENYENAISELDQDKISFAVEQLEKVKEFCEGIGLSMVYATRENPANIHAIINNIDNQIKMLKEGK